MTNFRICGLIVAAATLVLATVGHLRAGPALAKAHRAAAQAAGAAPMDAAITVPPAAVGAGLMAACTAADIPPAAFRCERRPNKPLANPMIDGNAQKWRVSYCT
jgi:hypothetical protein